MRENLTKEEAGDVDPEVQGGSDCNATEADRSSDGQREEGPNRNGPDVQAEIQYIENAIVTVDTDIISKYGGVQESQIG